MEWRGRRQSSNIEDRRGEGGFGGGDPLGRGRIRIPIGGVGRASGGGISGIVILIVLFFVLRACGIDPLQLLEEGGVATPGYEQSQGGAGQRADDETKQFVATILAETEDTWSGILQTRGMDYPAPTLVLFDGVTRSECGTAQSAMGPFYCPLDRKVYIDLSFYDDLARNFGASGDFAQAYVLAHEVGHHVQNLVGVLPKFNEMRQSMSKDQANALSVRVELQADCFAGIWGHFTAQKGLLESGDLEEALNAAQQIGDDRLQRRGQGYVVPDSFTHGTSAQRQTWFKKGFDSGRLDACDTFNNPI